MAQGKSKSKADKAAAKASLAAAKGKAATRKSKSSLDGPPQGGSPLTSYYIILHKINPPHHGHSPHHLGLFSYSTRLDEEATREEVREILRVLSSSLSFTILWELVTHRVVCRFTSLRCVDPLRHVLFDQMFMQDVRMMG